MKNSFEKVKVEINFKKIVVQLYFNNQNSSDAWLSKARNKIISKTSNIFSTIERLEDISIYISHFPYKNTDLTPSRYISYHWDNYYTEIYNLREYQIGLLNSISKLYEGSHLENEIGNGFKELYEEVPNLLRKATKIRNKHVHDERVGDSNTALLEALELLREFNTSIDHEFYSLKLKEHMFESSQIMMGLSKLLQFYLTRYFNVIESLIICDSGDIIKAEFDISST